MTEVAIQLASEQNYPTPADVEAEAVARGWAPQWWVRLCREGDRWGDFRGPYESQDDALEAVVTEAESGRWHTITLQEQSAYDTEQVAAERAFEARVG